MYEPLKQEILKAIITHKDTYTLALALDALCSVRVRAETEAEPNLGCAPSVAR